MDGEKQALQRILANACKEFFGLSSGGTIKDLFASLEHTFIYIYLCSFGLTVYPKLVTTETRCNWAVKSLAEGPQSGSLGFEL